MVSPPRESENLLHWQSDHDVPNRHIQGQRKSQQTTMFLPRPPHDCEMINKPFLLSNYSFFFFLLTSPTHFISPSCLPKIAETPSSQTAPLCDSTQARTGLFLSLPRISQYGFRPLKPPDSPFQEAPHSFAAWSPLLCQVNKLVCWTAMNSW